MFVPPEKQSLFLHLLLSNAQACCPLATPTCLLTSCERSHIAGDTSTLYRVQCGRAKRERVEAVSEMHACGKSVVSSSVPESDGHTAVLEWTAPAAALIHVPWPSATTSVMKGPHLNLGGMCCLLLILLLDVAVWGQSRGCLSHCEQQLGCLWITRVHHSSQGRDTTVLGAGALPVLQWE